MVNDKKECIKFQSLLSQFLDEELAQSIYEETKKHINECQDCSKELTKLNKLKSLLKNLDPVSPPPDFLLSLRRRIKEEEIKKAQRFSFVRTSFGFKTAFVSATLVLMFIAGFFLGRNSPREQTFKPEMDALSSQDIVLMEKSFLAQLEEQAKVVPETASQFADERMLLDEEKASSLPLSELEQPFIEYEIFQARATGLNPLRAQEAQFSLAVPVSLNSKRGTKIPPQALGPGIWITTPSEFVKKLVLADPDFKDVKIYPQRNGALVLDNEKLLQVTISEEDFVKARRMLAHPSAFIPSSFEKSVELFNLKIRELPTPLK